MIRITGGAAKGRTLKIYQGGMVRPTTDKVRQAIFNILEHRYHLDFTEVNGLDLFAGSGSLGLELLSRGGREITFVESDRRAIVTLRANLSLVDQSLQRSHRADETRQTRVFTQRVERFLKTPPNKPFDLVFADPPYRDELGVKLLESLDASWVSDDGVVVIEHAKHDLFEPPETWELDDRRAYGDTFVSYLQRAIL